MKALKDEWLVDSRYVAELFERRHKNILRAIENLKCSDVFRRVNYLRCTYRDDQNKKQPCYKITRDGFKFLVMGFTGKKAAKIKEEYISLFQQMNAMVKETIKERDVNMQELQLFTNPDFGSIRTLELNGEPWFVGKDVAEILGYSNSRKAIADHIDDEDKKDGVTIRDSIGREQTPIIINESGLYSLILSSKLPTAKQFKHWVTSEVLPSIRKHGAYVTPPTVEQMIADPDFAIKLLTELKDEQSKRKQLEDTVAVQTQQITELQPKASYYDVVLNSKDLVSATQIAKDYGKSGMWFNKLLHEKKIQFKQGNIWLLYQKYAEQGYTSTKTQTFPGTNGEIHTKVHTYWTQKGRLFIYELLKKDGVLPLIEQQEQAKQEETQETEQKE